MALCLLGGGNASLWAQSSDSSLSDPVVVPLKPGSPSLATPLTGVITLEEVFRRVESYGPKYLGAELTRRQAGARRLERQGAFDPLLLGSSEFVRYNSSSDPGKAQNAVINTLQTQLLTRSGVQLSAGGLLNAGDVKTPYSPTGTGGEYFVGLRVPLLRGLVRNDRAIAESQALLGEPFADTEFINARLGLLQDAGETYWEWASARQRLGVADRILGLAQFRYNAVRARVDAGDLPAIDVVEARQEVLRRQGALVKAQVDFQKAAIKLTLYLWEADGSALPPPTVGQAPAKLPEPTLLTDPEFEDTLRQAYRLRPELVGVALQQRITRLEADLARNLLLPQVDLVVQPGVETGEKSIGGVVRAGVSVAVPLRQRTARGRLLAAQLRLEKLAQDARQFRQQIEAEVRGAGAEIRAAYELFRLAREELEMALMMERGERERFAQGDSSLFLVNQRERATAEAANKVIDVQTQYQQARLRLLAASGQL